jgi:biotin operon repressor
MNGWISLQKQVRKNWVWDDPKYFRAWVDMLMMANYSDVKKPYKDSIVLIKRGEFPVSYRKLGERWGMAKNTVIRFINRLKADTMIDTHTNYGFTLVKIVNYDKYQSQADTGVDTGSDTPSDTVTDTVGGTTIIKDNKINKINKFRAKPKNLEMVVEFFKLKNIPDPQKNAEKFYSHYESVGWFRGKSKIKNWKMCVSQWDFTKEEKKVQSIHTVEQVFGKTPMGEFKVYCKNEKCKSYGATLFAKNKFDIQKGCRCGYGYQPDRPKKKILNQKETYLSNEEIFKKIGFNMKSVA